MCLNVRLCGVENTLGLLELLGPVTTIGPACPVKTHISIHDLPQCRRTHGDHIQIDAQDAPNATLTEGHCFSVGGHVSWSLTTEDRSRHMSGFKFQSLHRLRTRPLTKVYISWFMKLRMMLDTSCLFKGEHSPVFQTEDRVGHGGGAA